MNRPGRTGGGHSECLAEKIGQAARVVHAGVELGDRPEHGEILDYLIEVFVSGVGVGAAADGDDR